MTLTIHDPLYIIISIIKCQFLSHRHIPSSKETYPRKSHIECTSSEHVQHDHVGTARMIEITRIITTLLSTQVKHHFTPAAAIVFTRVHLYFLNGQGEGVINAALSLREDTSQIFDNEGTSWDEGTRVDAPASLCMFSK